MDNVSWWAIASALAAGCLGLSVPGLLATLPLRLRPLPRLALAAPASLALIGCVGVIDGLLHLRFHWSHVLIAAAVIAAVLWPIREKRPHWSRPRLSALLPVTAWAVSSVAFALVLLHQVPSFDLFSQSYDNLFHLNATQSILETGNASSLQLRTLINTDRTISTYPAGWHTAAAMICQITGVSIGVAFNALAIAVVSVAWLPGIAWLTSLVVAQRQRTAGLCASLLLGTAFGFFPYALLIWGVLYPTFLAYALFPSGLALAMLLAHVWLPRWAPAVSDQVRPWAWNDRWMLLGLAAVWWLGAFFTHPRSLVSMVLLIVPLVLWICARAIAVAWKAGGARRRRMLWWLGGAFAFVSVAAVAAVLVVFRVFHVASRPVGDHLNGPQAQAVQTVWDGLWQVLTQNALVGLGLDMTGPLIILAIVVLTGLVIAFRRSDLRWMIVAYALIAVLFAIAAGSNSDMTKILTGLWYKDRYRLSALLPLLGVPLATLAVLRIAALTRWPRVVALGSATIVAASGWVGLWAPVGAAAAHEYRLENVKTTDFVDARQIAFMRQVADVVPADQLLLGDPWDGSGLSWLYADRRPVFPHLNGQWDPDRLLIAQHLDQIESDPAVCTALRHLNVHYLLVSTGEFDGGDPSGNKFAAIDTAVSQGLFTPVLSDGESALLRIDQCS
ncbi:DUF6541 family protein [Pseudoclavibacter sp. CFCC 13796]|uniref:DUF6541 family protein n=1 Tax=Pseudoclavibacter sp. CFCC 13796 TaxID=2615179 RepID=UPI00298E2A67|nr:DUF6541 family protein [Pseudoclavibacter sp. CFCC 13796]